MMFFQAVSRKLRICHVKYKGSLSLFENSRVKDHTFFNQRHSNTTFVIRICPFQNTDRQ